MARSEKESLNDKHTEEGADYGGENGGKALPVLAVQVQKLTRCKIEAPSCPTFQSSSRGGGQCCRKGESPRG